MERLGILAEMFVEDVNKEDSMVIELFDTIVNFLFKVFQLTGIPFLVYVLLEFAGFF
ncbi:hypothetical protein G3A_23220 [Bacillus sp. 17376]|uniref:Uncharacterized protein n=1 Tax=Mesobacillus boroniphilus JCM 21738 TaxID=1294265 RepID=W4RL57_9BACI|nr:hypothetical protein [Mesobacillus boroniphilus]ESU30165.1 hypothetical protein G3A_23220 [Bacillus sp. 17376]GAE44319.1 hypothetical protein JCM21738_1021 [Mesobacillus boroniphilus JCM 21738]